MRYYPIHAAAFLRLFDFNFVTFRIVASSVCRMPAPFCPPPARLLPSPRATRGCWPHSTLLPIPTRVRRYVDFNLILLGPCRVLFFVVVAGVRYLTLRSVVIAFALFQRLFVPRSPFADNALATLLPRAARSLAVYYRYLVVAF